MADGATNTAGNCFCHSVLDGRQTTKLLNMQTQRVSKIISDAQLTVSVTKTRVRTYVIFGSRNAILSSSVMESMSQFPKNKFI